MDQFFRKGILDHQRTHARNPIAHGHQTVWPIGGSGYITEVLVRKPAGWQLRGKWGPSARDAGCGPHPSARHAGGSDPFRSDLEPVTRVLAILLCAPNLHRRGCVCLSPVQEWSCSCAPLLCLLLPSPCSLLTTRRRRPSPTRTPRPSTRSTTITASRFPTPTAGWKTPIRRRLANGSKPRTS